MEAACMSDLPDRRLCDEASALTPVSNHLEPFCFELAGGAMEQRVIGDMVEPAVADEPEEPF